MADGSAARANIFGESGDALRARLARGDLHPLAEEFSRNRERLRRMVNFRLDRRLIGRIDADDVLQEAYVEATRRVQHFIGDETVSLFVWLRSIIQQTMTDLHRRHLGAQKRDAGREVSIHGARPHHATSVSLAYGLAANSTTPSRAFARKELMDNLVTAISTMSDNDQEVIAMRHFEELSNNEVAEVLGMDVKAASIRYVRAIRRLKELARDMPELAEFL